METRAATPSLPAILLLLFAGAATALWLATGWKLEFLAPFGSAFPEFPARALAALAEASATALLLLLAGAGILHGAGARMQPGPAAWALCFLAGGAVAGAFAAWVAFMRLVPLEALLVAWVLATRAWEPLRDWRPRLRGAPPEAWLAGAAVLLVVIAALAPAAESDGLRYHLVGPQEWRRAHRFVPIPFSANTNIPAHLGLLAACSSWVSDTGRVLQLLHATHLGALVILCGAIGGAAARAFGGHRTTAAPALALLCATIPVIAAVGAWPFSDVASAAYLMGAVWVLGPGSLRGRAARVGFASLLLGACVATKISNLPLACLAGLWALALALRGRAAGLVALAIVPGLLVLGPWLVKNTLYHGNPVYPIGWGVLGGPEWSAANDEFYKSKLHEKGIGHGAGDLLRSPLDITVRWERFEAQNPGPAPLALLPAAALAAVATLRRRRFASREALLLTLLLAGWLVWFRSYQSVRFLVPQLLALVLLGGAWLMAAAPRAGRAILAGMALLGVLWIGLYRTVHVPAFQAAIGAWGEEFFLAKRFAPFPALRWLESAAEPGEPVFYIGEHRAAYAHRFRPVTSDWFDTPRILTEIRATRDNAEMLERWRAQGIRYVLANLAELSLYEELYFRPRFTPEEWERFAALRTELLDHVAIEAAPGVLILELPAAAAPPPPTPP